MTWHARRPVSAIPPALAPLDIQMRMAAWSEHGREFKLLNLTLDSLPVVMVMCEGDRYPFIAVGCAAAETYTGAIAKAFLECEMIAVSWATQPEPPPALKAVVAPKDHGLLYANPGNEHRVDWLLEAPEAEPTERHMTMEALCAMFKPLVVDLHTPGDASDLWVVKVFSDKLLPISFGYQSEPHGHSRLQALGLTWGDYPSYPHFFG